MMVLTRPVAILFAAVLIVLETVFCKELVNTAFNVVPGGQALTHVEKLNDMTCEFSYVCQGGTLEEWQMLISSDERGNYVCKVSRPDGSTTSYLFFQNFEVKITGGKILGSAVMGEDGKECGEDEFFVDYDNNLVTSASGFKSHLNKVFVVFKTGREEL